MWTHYFRTALRALTNQRFFSFVNLLGLSIGLASVVAISLFVRQELGHDAWLPDQERLFRIDTVETIPDRESLAIARTPGPLSAAMERDFPQVEAVTRGYTAPLNVRPGAQTFAEQVMVADPDFFSVLRLPFAAGSPEQALASPVSIALSERAAERYFGRGDAVGHRLTLLVPEAREFVVSAVFRNIPEASHLAFDVVIPHAAYFRPGSDGSPTIPESWAGAYFHTYARLREPADAAIVQRGLPAFTDRHVPRWITDQLQIPAHQFYNFRLVPVRDVHFDGAAIDAMKPTGSRTTVAALAGVAGLILLIAGINFANLSAARSALRAREVALRKVVGARRRQILAQFLTEAAVLTAIAGLLALALVELSLPWISAQLGAGAGLPPPSAWEVWAGLLFLVLLTAAAAGFYPSMVASSIRPAEIFRRGEASTGGGRVRTLLVTVQFTISIALIVITLGMAMQTRFAGSIDLGFARENMLVVRVPDGADQEMLARRFREIVERRPEVVSASLSSSVPSDRSEDNLTVSRPRAVRPIQLGFHRVDPDFFASYRVSALAGRLGSTRDATAEGADAVLNRSALRRLGFARPEDAIGQVLQGPRGAFTVIGVVPDLHFRSLHETVRDELYIIDRTPGGAVSIRYRTEDLPGFLAAVEQSWANLAPDKPIVREFLDDLLDSLYERERANTTLLSLFAAVAIILSCLGLFALVAFTIQRHTREIALRKVMGAGAAVIVRG
ncbi:MAG: ABC transporter permease, partial [Pseudorhodoplanes sp.]